jgi:hypothetical protein
MAQADGGSLVVNGGQMRALQQSCGSTVVPCPAPAVVIELAQAVACPGHALQINAKGSPAGGTYAWTVEGAQLTDRSGRAADNGDTVYLRSFAPDNASGRIPETTAKVSVKYTHSNGSASASKEVTVHSIDFEVSGGKPRFSDLEAKEDSTRVFIEQRDANVPTMNVDHQVKIRLGASCPRKQECVRNHRVGWLQDITAWEKSYRFRRRLVQWKLLEGPPIRDALSDDYSPFYAEPVAFDADGSAQVNHSDSPAFGASWEDDRHDPPEASPLENVVFKLGFTAWLAVQNREWIGRDATRSLVYLGNFDWSIDCVVTVVPRRPGGRRSKPQYFAPRLEAIGKGQGARTPSFTEQNANAWAKPESTPLPGKGKTTKF